MARKSAQPDHTGAADLRRSRLRLDHHIAEFFALFGGGISEPGWIEPQFSQARLAIIPGYSHYNLGQAPEVAQVIERFLTQPTSAATQFAPE